MKKIACMLAVLGLLCGTALMAVPQQQADVIAPPVTFIVIGM